MSNASFVADVKRWVEKSKLAPDLVVRKVLFDAASMVVQRTPVDSGRARGNWQFGTDGYPTNALEDTGDPLGKLHAGMQLVQAGHIHYLVNNVPYIGNLEYGGFPNPPKKGMGKTSGGFSTQAPQGMVRITILELKANLEQNAAAVAEGS